MSKFIYMSFEWTVGAFRCCIQPFRVIILVAPWGCKGPVDFWLWPLSQEQKSQTMTEVTTWFVTTVTRGVSVRDLDVWFLILCAILFKEYRGFWTFRLEKSIECSVLNELLWELGRECWEKSWQWRPGLWSFRR